MTVLKTAAFTLLTLYSAGALAAQRSDTIIRTATRPVHAGVATELAMLARPMKRPACSVGMVSVMSAQSTAM